MNIAERMRSEVSKGTALAAFNAPSFDVMLAISKAAVELDSPAIIQTSSRLVKQHGPSLLAQWFEISKNYCAAETYLHLDHCNDHKLIRQCIESGWNMVMFDGSHLPLDENIAQCSEISSYAHKNGVAVEGEVGAIGGEEDGFKADANYATNEEIERLSKKSGIDCIAVGFGNVHGDYTTKSKLKWNIYENARELSGLPLVLHGGTGLTDPEFDRAIKAGSAKINISTELKKAYQAAVCDAKMLEKLSSSPSVLHDEISKRCHFVASKYISKFKTTRILAS